MNRRITRRTIVALMVVGLLLGATGRAATPGYAASGAPASRASTQPPVSLRSRTTQTTLRDKQPDPCRPNDRREQACPTAIDAVNGPYSFIPPDNQAFYRIDLGAPNGQSTLVAVRASGSLDLQTTISRDNGSLLGIISSPAVSTTLAADVGRDIVIQVENRTEGDTSGQTYTIEIRRVLPLAPPSDSASLPPDKLENNWNPVTAAPIAVGVVYDLNFVCPVAWGCVGGDHDYLRLPVKRGGHYLICTFDLGPGVDTEIDLFWGTSDTPIVGNDDARPNVSLLSVIRWVAPADGDAIIRIAPLPLDPAPAPAPRASLTVTVTVVSAPTPASPPPAGSARTPTPTPATPRVGVRVQLVTAFGERLAEAVTEPSGRVVFTHDYAASSTLFIRLPAAGVELPIDPRQPAITIGLPIGETP